MKKKTLSTEVLLAALEERYSSIHNLRDRIQSITLRILWILLWISGWIIQSKTNFNCNEKIFFMITIISSMIIFYLYFEDLKKGALSQINTASKIEERLWFFEGDNPIYPSRWNKEINKLPFLKYQYIMLLFWFTVLTVSILYFT
jgi:hypothetical protein